MLAMEASPALYPATLTRAERRARGVYYTPEAVVAHVAAAALSPLSGQPAPRILDPAVGDGAFLRAAARLLPRGLLFGVDLDPRALELARAAAPAVLVRADALGEARLSFESEGLFDAVVGNPPWGGWDRGLEGQAKNTLRRRFVTARGRIDPFALFIERATGLLRPGGRLGFVLPDIFLLKNYPVLRQHVLDNFIIEELVHWGRCFPAVNLDACSMVARRRGGAPRGESNIVRCMPEGPEGRVAGIAQGSFRAAPGHAFNLALDGPAAALLARLEKDGVALGAWLEAHEGIHSGNMRSMLFVPPGASPPADADAALLRPLLFGRDEIAPFRLRPSGWRVIYDASFIARQDGGYASLGRPAYHASPKLLLRRTGDRLIAALDRDGLCASNNLFVARLRTDCPVPIDFLEGYLNSALATWCFRARVPRAGRLFAELKLTHLRAIPVPRAGAGLISRVTALVEAARRGDSEARDQMDSAFCEAAGLSAAERRLLDSIRKTHL